MAAAGDKEHLEDHLHRRIGQPDTHAQRMAEADLAQHAALAGRHFSLGSRPVLRWIKGNGRDDAVTRTAIAQATRLFGDTVDYCLCTHDIAPDRARDIMAWSAQPVEWWPLGPEDNPRLAALLMEAGCPPEHFGYWWKWFPERVRPGGPEWILDGDMVVTAKPPWFDAWAKGEDPLRAAQDDKEGFHIYGRYAGMVDFALALYSGIVSLPPGLRYMATMEDILRRLPLAQGHDGRRDMCEQGVVAACFQELGALPIPLNEFPFGRAVEKDLDFGRSGDIGRAWAYHFGLSFRRDNPHFHRLTETGPLFSGPEPDVVQRASWLGNIGQWGVPGWSSAAAITRLILRHALEQPCRDVLELGTSRGRLSAILAGSGFRVATVDRVDRGARQNLAGLDVEVIVAEAVGFLAEARETHGLIVMDLHGNSPREWARYAQPLMGRLKPGGTLLINNAVLDRIPEWREENGVAWFLSQLPKGWQARVDDSALPGLAIVTRP